MASWISFLLVLALRSYMLHTRHWQQGKEGHEAEALCNHACFARCVCVHIYIYIYVSLCVYVYVYMQLYMPVLEIVFCGLYQLVYYEVACVQLLLGCS